MPTVTYTGPLRRGRQHFADRSHVDFVRGAPVDVTEGQAKALGREPAWGGSEPSDDLDGLDKEALLAVAQAEDVEISTRWGEARLTDTIRAARRGEAPSEED